MTETKEMLFDRNVNQIPFSASSAGYNVAK